MFGSYIIIIAQIEIMSIINRKESDDKVKNKRFVKAMGK